jgi:hypothetical protein
MTYIYYKSTTSTTEPKISEKQLDEWRHLADKKNWRITQLPNGYYQTEVILGRYYAKRDTRGRRSGRRTQC